MMEYFYNVNNYVAQASLNIFLSFEAFWGETPDISMICFKFLYPVFFQDWTDKSLKFLMHPGRFVGITWNVGNPITFKVI